LTTAVVVGTGFGCRVHVPALRAAGYEVVALVGRDPDRTARRAARLEIAHSFPSLNTALRALRPSVVTIATPPDTHAQLAITAVQHGCEVICEKPFALDASDARRMRDAAEAARVTALVGHEFRWAEDRATIGRAIAAGLIGEPRLFSVVQYVPLVADVDAPTPEWWFDRERGGGWLSASGSHLVDQIRSWLGEFEYVSATLPTVADRTDAAEDSFVVRATLVGGIEGVLHQTAASWIPRPTGVTVVAGTTGTLTTDGGRVSLSDRDGERILVVDDDLRLPKPNAESDDRRQRFTHLELGPYTRLCEALRDGGKSTVPVPTFADGVAAMEVLDAIRVSAQLDGARVPVAHQIDP
jgi:predicted dehydrogenase